MLTTREIPDAKAIWKASASAKENGDFISLKAYSGYSLEIADPQAIEHLLEPDASDEEIGKAILEVLKQSRFLSYDEASSLRLNAMENFEKWTQMLMERYGYKTKRALFKEMKSCGIYLHEGIITIRPSHHEKSTAWSGNWFTEEDYVKVPADSPPHEIGKALRLSFSRCTG
jgi:hypothetical protein